jgi:hypothetical protein
MSRKFDVLNGQSLIQKAQTVWSITGTRLLPTTAEASRSLHFSFITRPLVSCVVQILSFYLVLQTYSELKLILVIFDDILMPCCCITFRFAWHLLIDGKVTKVVSILKFSGCYCNFLLFFSAKYWWTMFSLFVFGYFLKAAVRGK